MHIVLNSIYNCCLCLLLQILIVEYSVAKPPTVVGVAVSNVRMGFISLEQFATSAHLGVQPVWGPLPVQLVPAENMAPRAKTPAGIPVWTVLVVLSALNAFLVDMEIIVSFTAH